MSDFGAPFSRKGGMEFMDVEDMTNAELLFEYKNLEHLFVDEFDVVLMYRLEELDHEMTRREE